MAKKATKATEKNDAVNDRKKALETAIDRLKKGELVGVFPEGRLIPFSVILRPISSVKISPPLFLAICSLTI